MQYTTRHHSALAKLTALILMLSMVTGTLVSTSFVTGSAAPPVAEIPFGAATLPEVPVSAEPLPERAAAAPLPEVPDTEVLQPNVTEGKDTWIGNTAVWIDQFENFGTDQFIYTANSGLNEELRTLIEFDIPDKPNSYVKSATLSLYAMGILGNPQNVSVHAVTNAWDEGINYGGHDSANWSYRLDTNTTLFSQNFEATNGGLTPTNDWEWGTYSWAGIIADPPYEPPAPHSGTRMWGTVLNNEYNNLGGWSNLTLTMSLTGVSHPTLSFWDWYDVFENFDHGEVYVNGNLELDRDTAYNPPTGWVQHLVDLSAYSNQSTVDITFSMYASTVVSRAGWYIDDITVYGGTPTAWTTSGGDYVATPASYQMISEMDCWYSWNVTPIVRAIADGSAANDGFLLKRQNLEAGDHYISFLSSDWGDPLFRPKLTISWGAEIINPIGAQLLQEDDLPRSIPLSGHGLGTVETLSGSPEFSSLFPFYGYTYDQVHIQYLYNSSQVGAEGALSRISFNRLDAAEVGSFSDFRIMMAHTDKDVLDTTFANNPSGLLTEVFPTQKVFVNSSGTDTWIHFDLNGKFTYDSAHNLLVDISWNGDTGTNVSILTQTDTGGMVWDIAGNPAGTSQDRLPITRFFIDAAANGIVDGGTGTNIWPFDGTEAELHVQVLYNSTLIGHAGSLQSFAFQSDSATPEWETFGNLSIRMAHSSNDTLGTVFEANRLGPWFEVLNSTAYNVSHNGLAEWIEFDLSTPFNYNGLDNLLIDIRWSGTSGANVITLAMNYSNTYAGQMGSTSLSSASGGIVGDWLYNFKATFGHSPSLIWSATSSEPAIFTAGVSGNSLVITPMADMSGTGIVTLRLANSNGEYATQAVPVTITAVNDAPLLAPLADITCVEDIPFDLDIVDDITDVDDPIENITVSTDSDYATVNGTVITFLYPEGVTDETVKVTLKDASGSSASQDLDVTVTMVNDDPWFEAFPASVTVDATVSRTINLDPQDEESPPGQLSISTTSQYATVTGHALQLLFPKGMGTAQVTLYLVDNMTYGTQNNVTYTLNVVIVDHPEVIDYTPEGTAVPVTSPIEVTFDMDMNALSVQNAFTMMLGTTEINGTFSWPTVNTTMRFTPSDHLTNGVYTVRIAASAETLDGIRMLNAFEWNFTAALGTFDGDGDGMPDQYEIDNGLDPNVDDAQADSDGDGMPNIYEYENNLDPMVNDADGDADGDGATNLDEYEAGTDPNDPDSKPSDFTWIILVLVVVAVVAVLLVVVMMKRKPKEPQQAGPEQWQEPEGQMEPQDGPTEQPYEQGDVPPPPPEPPQNP